MTLPELVQRIIHGNVGLTWQGETLHVSVPKNTLTPALKQALRQYKPVLQSWRQQVGGWGAATRELWEERAAIMEYEGGLSRADAEWQAYLCVKGEQHVSE